MKRGSMKIVPISKSSLLLFLSLFFIPFAIAQQTPCCQTLTTTIDSPGAGLTFRVAFSQNGCLAVGYNDGTVRIFPPTDLAACQYPTSPADPSVTTISSPGAGRVFGVAFSQNGCLAVGYQNSTVRIFPPTDLAACQYPTNPADPSVTTISPIDGIVQSVTFSQNGCLAVSYLLGRVRIFPPTDLAACQYPTSPADPSVTVIPAFAGAGVAFGAGFSQNGCLAVGYQDGTVRVFSPTNLAACIYSMAPTPPTPIPSPGVVVVRNVVFSQNGCLAVGYGNGTVGIFAPTNAAACIYSTTGTTIGSPGVAQNVAFSPDECLAVSYNDGTVRIFPPTNLAPCQYPTSPTDPSVTTIPSPGAGIAFGLAFSQNGCLAVGYNNGTVRIFVPTELQVTIVGDTSVCIGDTITLTASVTGGTLPYTFAWTGPNGFTASTQAITIPNATAANAGSYTVDVTDPNSCSTSAQATVTVNNPSTPSLLTAFANCNGAITVTGTADANTSISVFADNMLIGTGASNASGSFDFTVSTSLSSGTYSITVHEVDSAGCASGMSNAITVTVSQVGAPVLATASTNCNGVVTVTGTADANTSISVFADNMLIGTGTTNASGSFDFTASTSLSNGSYSITVREIDSAGCTSGMSNSIEVTVDRALLPVLSKASAHCNGKVTVRGTAEAHVTIIVFANGSEIGRGTANANGTFDFTASTSLTNGTYSIKVEEINTAGCTSGMSNAITVTVDRALLPVLSKASAHCNGKVTVKGIAEAHATIIVFANGTKIGRGAADANGIFDFTVSKKLNNGKYSIRVKEINSAGCRSERSNKIKVTVDQARMPVLSKVKVHCDGTLRVIGTAEPHSTITVFANGRSLGTGTSNDKGAFSFSLEKSLSDGKYTITVRSRNRADCKSAHSNSIAVVIDKAQKLVINSVSQRVVIEGRSRRCRVTVSGTAEPHATITISVGGFVQPRSVIADEQGEFTIISTQLVSSHNIVVTATNAAGCSTASDALAMSCIMIEAITLASADIPVTSNQRPILVGTIIADGAAPVTRAAAGTNSLEREVSIIMDGNLLGVTQSDSTGKFTFTPNDPISKGAHTFIAKVVDNGSAIVSNQVRLLISNRGCTPLVAGLINKLCPIPG
jgi:hypothetical protein